MSTDVEALVGPDPAPFESLISRLMSSSNEERSQAEFSFNLCKQTHPDSLALKLGHLLQFSSPHPDARAMSAILLRKLLAPSDDSYIWPCLSPSSQSSLKSLLLSSSPPSTFPIPIGSSATPSPNSLPPTPGLTFSLSSSTASHPIPPNSRNPPSTSSPSSPATPCSLISPTSMPPSSTASPLPPSPDVRIAALNALINFIQCLPTSAHRDRFQDLLPAMIKTLTEALNSSQEALELLIDLDEPRGDRIQPLSLELTDVHINIGDLIPYSCFEVFLR